MTDVRLATFNVGHPQTGRLGPGRERRRPPPQRRALDPLLQRPRQIPAGYHQIDYVLPSTSLAATIKAAPEIMRKGMPLRADRYQGERFDGTGKDRPKSSDHCPVITTITL